MVGTRTRLKDFICSKHNIFTKDVLFTKTELFMHTGAFKKFIIFTICLFYVELAETDFELIKSTSDNKSNNSMRGGGVKLPLAGGDHFT